MSEYRGVWSGRTRSRVGAIVVLLAGAISPPLASSAYGQGLQHGASPCANNPQRMIYVALGRHVYRQPAENLKYVHGISLETAAGLPIPPRRAEPEGCPDHPLRGIAFKFGPFSDIAAPGIAEAGTGGLVQLIEIDPYSWWDTHERYALGGAGVCRTGDRSEMAPNMTICRPVGPRSAGPSGHSSFAAIIDSRYYAGPLDQPLAVLCSSGSSNHADDQVCEISYRLERNVGVWYQFETSLIPLSHIVDFDRELRRRIAQAEIADYGWPIPPLSRPAAPN